MPHDRDLGVEQGSDQSGPLAPPLDLDRRRPPLLQEAARIPDRVAPAGLKGHVRHVPHHQGAARRARHGARVVEHFLHRDREGALVPEHIVPETVADQEDIDPGGIEDACRGVVVGGQHDDLATGPPDRAQIGNGDLRDGLDVQAGRTGTFGREVHGASFSPPRGIDSRGA